MGRFNQLAFDFSASIPEISEPTIQVPLLTDWQRVMAIPVTVMTSAFKAMTGEGRHPCKSCKDRDQ